MIYDRESLERSLSLSSDKGEQCEITTEQFGSNNTLNVGGVEIYNLSLVDLFNLKQAINKKMSENSQVIADLTNFHKDSNRHWSKLPIYKDDDSDSEFKFSGSIIEENPLSWYYEAEENGLSSEEVREKVEQDFYKETGSDKEDYDMVHYREDTSVYAKTEQNIVDLYQWMDDKIIQPYLQYVMEKNGITGVDFEEGNISIN